MQPIDKDKLAIELFHHFKQKKEEVRNLTLEILDLERNSDNALDIKKKITSILSAISDIVSYSNSGQRELELCQIKTELVLLKMKMMQDEKTHTIDPRDWFGFIDDELEEFCNTVNSIKFDFTKKGLSIKLPKNLNIGQNIVV